MRSKNLKKFAEMVQFTQFYRETIQPLMAVFIYETVQPNQPITQTLIQRMIEAYCQCPTACARKYQRHQNQRTRIPECEANA